MDRFEEMQNIITVEAFTKAGKKFEQIAEAKSVTQIIDEVLDGLKKANVKVDSSTKASRWLAICAGNSTIALSSGKVNGVPILVCGTSSYMTNGFYFCVEKKNGKPRAIYMSNRKIANLYNDDFSAVEPERIEKYAKRLLKYVEEHGNDEESQHLNAEDEAMEAFFQSGWEKLDDAKRAPLDKKIEFWYTSKFKKHDDFCKSTKDLAQVISGYPNMKDHKFTYKMIAGIAVAISDEYIVIGQGDLEKGAINIEAFWIKPDKLDQYIASSMSKFKKFNSSKVV